MTRWLVAVLVLSLSGTVQAQDGNKLLRWCLSKDPFDEGYCLGYVAGVWDATLDCAPPGVKAGQVRDVVVNFLQAKPQHRHRPPTDLIREAIQEAWPCSR